MSSEETFISVENMNVILEWVKMFRIFKIQNLMKKKLRNCWNYRSKPMKDREMYNQYEKFSTVSFWKCIYLFC